MEIKYIEKIHETDDIWSFRFQPETLTTWVAGQYLRLELPNKTKDEHDNVHWFTISSAPEEGYIQVSTRVRDSVFKQTLNGLKPGDSVIADTIGGDFIWQDSASEKVFVAGGIGVTPFRSILASRKFNKLPIKVHLIYAGQSESFAFLEEFNELSSSNPDFKVTYLSGKSLTASLLLETDPKLLSKLVYLSGPETMVEELGASLKDAGLAETSLKQDWFPGYDVNSYFQTN
jgi:ferredoxin-NADP reductase